MRTITKFNDNWLFSKTSDFPEIMPEGEQWEKVDLPHTWNAQDGQDGGNDYWRGTAMYVKSFACARPAGERVFLEFRGAAMSAAVCLNGQLLAEHAGGYSTFRVDLTDALAEENLLCVSVDNSENNTVYPQRADFTFYGGIYRDVYLITVPEEHFELIKDGTPAIKVTPKTEGTSAKVIVEAWTQGAADGACVTFTLSAPDSVTGCYVPQDEAEAPAAQTGTVSASVPVIDGYACAAFTIENVHRWDGVDDPYLYTAAAALSVNGEVKDEISSRFGCRSFAIYPDKGFYLNNRPYPLRGVSRHQDRKDAGNAVTLDMMKEDMAVVRDIGANTLRLAHYQQAQEFYDLCDENGIIVWAEIPFITQFMPEGRENTLVQMKELITQCYNHPSIICWGLSNEITAASVVNEELMDNHIELNALCHKLDYTRPTVMAHAFMLEKDSDLIPVADLASYNLYFGWYLGDLQQNDEFFDEYHAMYPDRVIGFSEYGADCNIALHSDHPDKGDYTEEYQCLYHEHILKMIEERPYLWATHVWNLFDFAADGRDEGGKKGENQKGLVEFDHKTKKDAYYLYKAAWSKEPFVHVCGSRYVDRVGDETEIKVYTNQKSVTLNVDGVNVETKDADKVVTFRIPLTGEHTVKAIAWTLADTIRIRKVDAPNPDYSLTGAAPVVNWFDNIEYDETCYSINDTMGELQQNPHSAAILARLMEKAVASRGDVAKASSENKALQQMMARMSLKAMLKQAGPSVADEEQIKALNRALQQIKKG